MTLTKAVVFTHIHVSSEQAAQTRDAPGASAIIQRVVPCFKNLLVCRNVGLVYVYVDVGIEFALSHLPESDIEKGEISFSMKELESEERTRNCLKIAADEAIQELLDNPESDFDRAQAPRFQFVGLPHLLSLFNALFKIDPTLIKNLAGELRNFTYDSPKFVEAVIRLVRGAHPIHDQYPILRFDADVEVNEEGVGTLITAVNHSLNAFFMFNFFSGGYGRCDGMAEPVNDYAVRVHWLIDQKPKEVGQPLNLKDRGEVFLRDLGELGATQVASSAQMSRPMRELVQKKRKGVSANRFSPQVISGAGLFMSLSAIRALPPFMNSNYLTVWIDDHLKRRLHEAVGHLTAQSLERVPQTSFHQEREPIVTRVYLERILRGCLLHAMIVNPDGAAAPLALKIKEIIENPNATIDEGALRDQLMVIAHETADDILSVWKTADYGDNLLSEWAQECEVGEIITTTVDDALSYAQLVTRWHLYVNAIQRLTPVQAYWLFKRVEGASF